MLNESKLFSMTMNASSFENTFKQACALVELKKPDEAIKKFRFVCEQIEAIIRTNPNANIELHLVPLSLTKVSDIYKDRDDLDKALALMTTARKFLEYIEANKPNRDNEPSDDGADHEEYTIGALFLEMHKSFDMEDAPPKPDPEELVKMFQEAKKKREEEIAKENMQKLKEALEARKEKLRTSRWARFVEYLNSHPIGIAVGSIIFLAIFLGFALLIFKSDDNDPTRHLNRARRESESNSKEGKERGKRHQPRGKKVQDKTKKQQQKPHTHTHDHSHENYDAAKEQEKLQKLMEQFNFQPGEEPTPENFQSKLETMRADTQRKLDEIKRSQQLKSQQQQPQPEHQKPQEHPPEKEGPTSNNQAPQQEVQHDEL